MAQESSEREEPCKALVYLDRWQGGIVLAGYGLGTAVVIGIPTDVVPNPWFGRELGVRPIDVAVLIALSVLTGGLIATYRAVIYRDEAPGVKGTRVRAGSAA